MEASQWKIRMSRIRIKSPFYKKTSASYRYYPFSEICLIVPLTQIHSINSLKLVNIYTE